VNLVLAGLDGEVDEMLPSTDMYLSCVPKYLCHTRRLLQYNPPSKLRSN
jgi:hypothetical protein